MVKQLSLTSHNTDVYQWVTIGLGGPKVGTCCLLFCKSFLSFLVCRYGVYRAFNSKFIRRTSFFSVFHTQKGSTPSLDIPAFNNSSNCFFSSSASISANRPYFRITRFSLLFLLQKSPSVNSFSSLGNLSLTSCKLCHIRPPVLVALEMCGRISCTRDSRPGHTGHGVSYPPRLTDIRSLVILPSACPDPPVRRVLRFFLLILRIDERMFSHSSSVSLLDDFPGLTFLTATFLFNSSSGFVRAQCRSFLSSQDLECLFLLYTWCVESDNGFCYISAYSFCRTPWFCHFT